MILKAKFRFNRPIDATKDFVCIGDFAATAAGKQYPFDFMTYYGNVDKKDPAESGKASVSRPTPSYSRIAGSFLSTFP